MLLIHHKCVWAARKPARLLNLPRAMALRRGRQQLNRSWSLLATGEGSDSSELGILLQIAPTSVSRGCEIKPLSLYSALPSVMALPNSDSPAFKKKKKSTNKAPCRFDFSCDVADGRTWIG